MAQTLLPGSVLAMSDQAADRLLRLDSGDAALLYLHFLRHGDLSRLAWPQQRLDTALDQLKTLGMAPEQPPVSAPPAPEAPRAGVDKAQIVLYELLPRAQFGRHGKAPSLYKHM